MSQLSQTLRQFVPESQVLRLSRVSSSCTCLNGHAHSRSACLELSTPVAHSDLYDATSAAISQASDRQGFDNMIGGFRPSGGTARADDLALLLEERKRGDFVSLAKRMVSRDIFSFKFRNHFWIPMFQFDARDMSVKQEVRRVINELGSVLDNWTLARWFTEPNAWLRDRRPVDMMTHHFADVLDAARADRFIAAG